MTTEDTKKRLEVEFIRLKTVFGLDPNLKVVWTPSCEGLLSGEVKSECIFIYEFEADEALETLRHEVIDYFISQTIEPYKKITNRLIQTLSDDAYRKKERVVEVLSNFIFGE